MSVASSSRVTDHGSLHSILFPSTGSFRYAPQPLSGNSQNDQSSANGDATGPSTIIWGTDVNVGAAKSQFKKFILESKFTVEEADMDEARLEWQRMDEPRPLYLTKLEEIIQVPNEPYLTLNCSHLKEFNETLYRQLVNYPNEMIQCFDMAINELFEELYPDVADQISIEVRPFNIEKTNTIRSLNPGDLLKLMTISGMVTRCSSIVPEMHKGFFRCTVCTFTREVPVDNGRITEPHVCVNCNSKFSFELIHNRCKYYDKQLIKLQEAPDDMPAGQTPATVSLIACRDLIEKVHPGDRIYVTGIYRFHDLRVMPRQRRIKSCCRATIDCVHFRKVKEGRLHDESSSLRFNPDRVDALKALAQSEDIYERLANSLCPSIFGHMDVKKGVLMQLFGGTRKEAAGSFSDPKLRHFRADLNVLLCGDPGTSKSQILQFVHKLVPRGQYTSGKGSSAVGLTAYVTRDIDTKQLVLQTGALVMCDGGICCIDEFDKMSDSTRSVLHEVMEQQTLSIAKAGIVCQLNARTSVLAAANPVNSAWDKDKTIIDNIKMPDTLLSRFDLIFLLLDPNNSAYDTQLARHLISIYHGNEDVTFDNIISPSLLKDYIAYARAKIEPKMSSEAEKKLIQEYVTLRQKSFETKGVINVYPRNLESLVRLSEARAKLRLSNEVNLDDIDEAVRLTKEALKYSSTDPNTGKIGTVITI